MAYTDADLVARTGLTNASTYQIDIFRHIAEQVDNILNRKPTKGALVRAVAGSGKTTTVVAAAKIIPQSLRVCFLAFNKNIADELKDRLPSYVDAKTLNSLGWGICKRYADGVAGSRIGFNDFNNPRKVWNIVRREYDRKKVQQYGRDVVYLVNLAKTYGIVPASLEGNDHQSANGLRDDDATWASLLRHHGYSIDPVYFPTVIKMAREVLLHNLADEVSTDFADQKYFPVVKCPDGHPLPGPKYDIIIIDEAQDVSSVDLELVKICLKAGGLVVAVGDPNQGIYGFRGADTKAFDRFRKEFDGVDLPLSISYRCARKIVETARMVHATIEAAPNAREGEVAHVSLAPKDHHVGDMVLCRNNAPLIGYAYDLIRNRVPVFLKGRDIGKGLLTLLDNLDANTVVDAANRLTMWEDNQIRMIEQDDPDDVEAKAKVRDRADTLRVFITENADNSLDTLRNEIETMFVTNGTDKSDGYEMKGKVILSTIHKAKGLEANTVYFLDSFLMYPKYVVEGSWQYEQEKNLEYVAITRAMESLYFITTKGNKEVVKEDKEKDDE